MVILHFPWKAKRMAQITKNIITYMLKFNNLTSNSEIISKTVSWMKNNYAQ